ncbi:meiotic recombination protein REC114 isoform X2 [Betta splendens]|uniref:Meiotic recombination protein REC114 isoform X2 n=1 Tax=Betta splendens TaxID=158456 RepID=A0A6P7M539_BETSP|nr:meiotic recombination protein REC114 isoform X2 [Betta splendens]
MATVPLWSLKRYGRLVQGPKKKARQRWKIFDRKGNKPEIVLTIVESGHLLVLQGEDSLDTVSLVCGSDSFHVHQESDGLFFRLNVQGESRMMRMQFDGSNKAEAIKECSRAVEKLKEYVSVTSQDDAPTSSNQPPTEGKSVENEHEVAQGSSSMKDLAQHYLGETMTLPQVYRHCSFESCDLEPFLRVCLLDSSFHAFVEKVEGELRKLLQE